MKPWISQVGRSYRFSIMTIGFRVRFLRPDAISVARFAIMDLWY